MKKIGVALLGVGTVGGGTFEIITKNREYFKETQNVDVTVEAVLELNKERAISIGVPENILASNMAEISSNPNVDIVAEFIGGVEPAKTFIIQALKSGKSIVTANKELFAKHWDELEVIAREYNVGLYFEASCVGGVPIIRTLTDGMQANKIESLMGIINGTTNFILSKMADEGADYNDVLKKAQQLGYAELDPTADVEGFDSMYKLSILSSLAFHKRVHIEDIYREGISSVNIKDIKLGRDLGFELKLLGIGKQYEEGIEVRVHPTFVPLSHPLASIKDSFNAVHLRGDNVGDIMLYGRGAGALPTGSAIVSDIIYAGKKSVHDYQNFDKKQTAKILNDFITEYYLRLKVNDQVGVLANISQVFAKNNVSITAVLQKGKTDDDSVDIIYMTHKTSENAFNRAIEQIKKIDDVLDVCSIIRVER